MGRLGVLSVIMAGATAAAIGAIVSHGRGGGVGRKTAGGILIRDAVAYDVQTRLLLGSLYQGIAADVAAVGPVGARVLEVGCGPGHLSIRLAREHGFDVTGLDLDPAMIERARANAERADHGDGHGPSFKVGDAASLPFPDDSFDLVVSTLSMHHWADPAAGLGEKGRVLRSSGRALVWDLRPGVVPFHRGVPDVGEHVTATRLRVARTTPWPWPWRFSLAQRIELVAAEDLIGWSSA